MWWALKLSLSVGVVTLVSNLRGVHAQSRIPIPEKPLGVVYGNGQPTAPLHLEVFHEVLCPAAKAAWEAIKPLADEYGPHNLTLTVYQFPLPYHQYGFLATQVRTLCVGYTMRTRLELAY